MDDWLGNDPEMVHEINSAKKANKSKKQAAFSGLESALDIAEGSTPMPKNLPATIKKETKVAVAEVLETIKDPDEPFEDKKYTQDIIKRTIIRLESTLELMDGSLMIGAEPRMFEVYSDMSRTVLDACAKLMALQKQADMAVAMKAPPPQEAAQSITVTETKTKTLTAKGGNMQDLLNQLDFSEPDPMEVQCE